MGFTDPKGEKRGWEIKNKCIRQNVFVHILSKVPNKIIHFLMSIILHISYCYTAQNLSGNVQSVQLLNIDVYNSDICYHLECSFKKQFTEKSISKTSHVFKKKVIFLCHWNIICLRITEVNNKLQEKIVFKFPQTIPNTFLAVLQTIK